MEIFGVGGTELIAILIIMLVVAGPKRMIQWAYILGTYTAKLRAMWAETMTYVEKEFKQAGMDVELPKTPPTRGSLNKTLNEQVQKIAAPVTKPVQDTLNEASSELKQIKTQATLTEARTPSGSTNGKSDLGTWSAGPGKDEQSSSG